MESNALIVVGDKFAEFAKSQNIITLTQLNDIVKVPAKLFATVKRLAPGLGCRKDEYVKILESLKNGELGHLNADELVSYHDEGEQPNLYTHQHSLHNVLIGKTKEIEKNLYELPIIIDDRHLLMGDHQTGCHVQGIIITEAFRQSFIAVTEEYILPKDGQDKYFVINGMNIEFFNFLFPLPARIEFELLDIDANEFRTKLTTKMTAKQFEQTCATMEAKFVVYPSEYISEKEKTLSRKVLISYLEELKKKGG